MKKNLVFVFTAHQPYIRELQENTYVEQELFFQAINDTYLPLLQLFASLESDGIPFKIMLCLSPSVCNQLSDPLLQARYLEWMDRLIAFGETEEMRYESNSPQRALASLYLKQLNEKKYAFAEIYGRNILSKFSYYAEKGMIELLATAATHAYLPLYGDLREAVCAQIEAGLMSHRQYFSVNPEGFWLPHMGYTTGFESILRAYGFSYTILDSHGLLFASPAPSKGVFAPVRCQSSFFVFGRDYETPADLFDEPSGYVLDEAYRDQNRDVGFEASPEHMESFLMPDRVRTPTGFKYWTGKTYYNPEAACQQTKMDASRFLDAKIHKLTEAQAVTGSDVSLVCSFDAIAFGQKWYEGFSWLDQVFRQAAEQKDVSFVCCSALLPHRGKEPEERISPFPSAALGSGYGEDLLDNSNDWMLRYIRKAIERMVDLTDRFPDDAGLKERSLNLAAKEVLLAMSSDWPKMAHDQYFVDYAVRHLREHVGAFTTVYDSLGSNAISTEWLTRMEREHPIFSWINYRIFSTKK